MRNLTIIFALSAMLLGGACSETDSTVATSGSSETPAATSQANLSPEELGELGARIQKNPADARKLLSERGLDEKSFEQAVRKVAEDPDASKRYSDAYKRASA